MGKKIIDFKMRRGEENQRQGGGIKSDSIIYTPAIFSYQAINNQKVASTFFRP